MARSDRGGLTAENMTVLDEFAKAALIGELASEPKLADSELVARVWTLAAHMMTERIRCRAALSDKDRERILSNCERQRPML